MPRQPFDDTCDFVMGPDTSTPGVVRVTGPNRIVLADGISWVDPGIPPVVGWVTISAGQPFGGWDSVRQLLQPGLGDTVVVPSGGVAKYFVLAVDRVDWRSAPVYFRAHICSLPYPAGPPPYIGGGGSVPFANQLTLSPAPPPGAIVPGMLVLGPFIAQGTRVTGIAGVIVDIDRPYIIGFAHTELYFI